VCSQVLGKTQKYKQLLHLNPRIRALFIFFMVFNGIVLHNLTPTWRANAGLIWIWLVSQLDINVQKWIIKTRMKSWPWELRRITVPKARMEQVRIKHSPRKWKFHRRSHSKTLKQAFHLSELVPLIRCLKMQSQRRKIPTRVNTFTCIINTFVLK
jgi:hypothetical protein